MAHEMGHYVMKHIYWGVASYVLLSFIGMYLISRIINMCIRKWGYAANFKSSMFLNFTFIFLNFFCPLFCITTSNKLCFSYRRTSGRPICFRHDEGRKSGVKTFQYLSKTSLSQVNPPALVKFFLYTHPPIFERIHTFEQYEKEKKR